MTDGPLKPYNAVIWTNEPDAAGIRRVIMAVDSADAVSQIRAEFGDDCTYTVANDEDASRPR